MSSIFSTLGHAILDLVFPPRCEVCGLLQEPLICTKCLQQFAVIAEPYCQQCGVPFDPLARTGTHCAECHDEPPPFDAARAAGIYGGPLRHAIHTFKYDLVRALVDPLAEFMCQHIELPFTVDLLCPVPLYPSRERMRGFNQSCLLAERLGQHLQLPVDPYLLSRTQNTAPQMLLPRDQRRANVRGAFEVTSSVQDRIVGLVDDVFTTGSTLRECSRVLKRAGAARVLVLTLARTV